MSDLIWLFLACAIATYLTRIGGYLILSRFDAINHRLEAALDAVPYAVLTALVAPYLISKGPIEAFAMILAGAVALRLSLSYMLLIGIGAVALLRFAIGG